ncbi:MAG: hypothetical protein ACRD0J_04760 [Acidimicrobiales bacterium]
MAGLDDAWTRICPPAYRGATCRSLRANGWPDEVINALSGWADAPTTNLVISGPSWSGKTWAVAALLHKALADHWDEVRPDGPWAIDPGAWTNATEVFAANREDHKALTQPRWWVLDGLGIGRESLSDNQATALYAVVNSRYEHRRPTLATTTLAPKALWGYLGTALAARLMRGAITIVVPQGKREVVAS